VDPDLSYTIWYAPRTGSNLLCDALKSTGVAGTPDEHLAAHETFNLYAKYGVRDPASLHRAVRDAGGGAPVVGLKCQVYEPYFGNVVSYLAGTPGSPVPEAERLAVWHEAFPNCRHVVLTRRNKFRQAVSWYRATQSGEWFREAGRFARRRPIEDRYDAEGIAYFLLAAVSADAAIGEFVGAAREPVLTVVYEDLVADLPGTVGRVLAHLGIEGAAPVAEPILIRQHDEVSEEWVQRARADIQGRSTRRW
jgi:LPS sulfotransferase NodH